MKVLIDSVYLNSPGGKEILDLVINNLSNNSQKIDYYHLLDIRNKVFYENLNFEFCKPTIRDRKNFYRKRIGQFDKIICLANVPPPILLKNKTVIIFFHNALILQSSNSLPLFTNIKNFFKKLFIYSSIIKDYNWVVQTDLMKNKLSKSLNLSKDNIKVYPFFRPNKDSFERKNSSNLIRILYVTSDSPHKKNRNLLKAFKKAKFETKHKVILSLTINNSSINFNEENKDVIFLGNLTRDEINIEYSKSDFLVYPSVIESFGLPLIESTFYNMKIIASNSEYVNSVVEPSLSFDSNSVNSIKETIEKVVNLNKIKDSKLIVKNKLDSFINYICSDV